MGSGDVSLSVGSPQGKAGERKTPLARVIFPTAGNGSLLLKGAHAETTMRGNWSDGAMLELPRPSP